MAVLLASLILTPGCSDETEAPASDGSVADPSKALFNPAKILAVEITMPAADWEAVRKDSPPLINFTNQDCGKGPAGRNYTWKRATKVTVNGQVVSNVGIRKKGFFFVSDTKPGIKLKFDKYVQGQTLHGMERLTLNSNIADPSYVKQCLTYDLFRKAGLAAPRCNFATVKVNGQSLGLFTNVEAVKKRFLSRHFSDNDGDLYESTAISDLRDDWLVTYEVKTSSTDATRARIKAVSAALKQSDDKLVAALSPLVNLDKFYTYWAMEVLVVHGDGYASDANNHYIYFDPGDKNRLHFIPWGVDKTFYGGNSLGVYANTILPRRLYMMKATQAKYLAAMNSLLKDVWDETTLLAEINRMEKLIGAEAAKDPYLKAGGSKGGKGGKGDDFVSSIKALRDLVKARRAQIKKVVDSPPVWTKALLKMGCSGGKGDPTGYEGTGTFKTTHGATGSGTLLLKEGGKALTSSKVSSRAGADTKTSGRSVIELSAEVADSKGTLTYIARFSVADSDMTAGKTLKYDKSNAALSGALVIKYDSKEYAVGALSEGTLTLTKAGAIKGEAVEGSFTAKWSASGGKK